MIILIVVAALWLAFRVVAVLQMVVCDPDEASPTGGGATVHPVPRDAVPDARDVAVPADRPTTLRTESDDIVRSCRELARFLDVWDATRRSRAGSGQPGRCTAGAGPQDSLLAPQDAVAPEPGAVGERRSGAADPPPAVGPTPAVGAAWWLAFANALRAAGASGRTPVVDVLPEVDPPALDGDPELDWATALRRTLYDTVPRPDGGPACLGGREDDAYLRGWDDAVDWVGQGHDAEAPTWGGVAYMTGWNDAVRAISGARVRATAWPSPATGFAA